MREYLRDFPDAPRRSFFEQETTAHSDVFRVRYETEQHGRLFVGVNALRGHDALDDGHLSDRSDVNRRLETRENRTDVMKYQNPRLQRE